MAAFAWFYKMVSFPNQDKLSKTSRFTLWTALLAYGGGGLALVCVPSLWGQFLEFHVNRILEGYLRLSGIHLVALSFIYIIIAREGSFSSKNGPVLSSICERLILVNGILLLFLLKDFLPLYFALLFILMDSILSVLTLCIWLRETPCPSLNLYFNEIVSSLRSYLRFKKSSMSHFTVQTIGILQFCGGIALLTYPWLIQQNSHRAEQHTQGILSCTFLVIAIHGWFHVMAGGAHFSGFPIAAVFYRLVFIIPSTCVLYLYDQIDVLLFILLGSCESGFALIILFSIFLESAQHNRSIRMRLVFNSKVQPQEKKGIENLSVETIKHQ